MSLTTRPLKHFDAFHLLSKLSDITFPRKCPLCSLIIDNDRAVCSNCLSKIAYIERQTCSICGKIFDFSYNIAESARYTCGECRLHPPPFKRLVSAAPYEGGMKKMIRKFKYDGKDYLGKEIAEIIFDRCKKVIQDNNFDIITSVPLHINALKNRGFDQSFILAEHLGKMGNIGQTSETIVRRRDTASQTDLSRKERIANVKGAFHLVKNGSAMVKRKRILLVDDVSTTGRTVLECSKILMQGGAKEVSVITAAKA